MATREDNTDQEVDVWKQKMWAQKKKNHVDAWTNSA